MSTRPAYVLADLEGAVYCWPCLRGAIGAAADDLEETGRRLGNERCSRCGARGIAVLELLRPRRPRDP